MGYRISLNQEGNAAEFTLSGGVSEARILFDTFGVKDVTDGGATLTDETVVVTNHKGDLTVSIPAFDSYGAEFVIRVRSDHRISVEQIRYA